MSLDTMKEVLLDGQAILPFTGTFRQLEITPLPGKASICIGVRRCGKSTLMLQILEKLIAGGVSQENIVQLNFIDDRLHILQEQGLGLVTEAFYTLYPQKKNKEKVYFFFDEIQIIRGWETFVDRLMRTELCEVYITGSSAQMLSREIATQMRGRSLSWELFPFSFAEFLDFKKIKHPKHLSSKQRMEVQHAFEQYWKCGGFPEVLELEQSLRIKIHQEYFQTILYRDVVERYDIAHPKALRDVARYLLDNAASLYSLNALYGYLKSLGHKLQKVTVGQYLEWLEDSYFLFSVRLYDASLSRSNANPKKIYCVDHAMVTSISTGILVNAGHLLENFVFAVLRRKAPGIFYYRTTSGKEVDFMIVVNRSEKQLVQVCESLASDKTKKRELAALQEAMLEQKLSEGWVVTRNESQELETEAGVIHVVPAWSLALG